MGRRATLTNRVYVKSPVVEDLEFMARHGETWERALERVGMASEAVKRLLEREDRVDLSYRLRRDWEGMADWKARRRADRPKRRLRKRQARAEAWAKAWKRRAAAARQRERERAARERCKAREAARLAALPEREARKAKRLARLESVVRDRFPGAVDIEALVAELQPKCETRGCLRPSEERRKWCAGHSARLRRYGYDFPEVPLDKGSHEQLRQARQMRQAQQEAQREATAEEEMAS